MFDEASRLSKGSWGLGSVVQGDVRVLDAIRRYTPVHVAMSAAKAPWRCGSRPVARGRQARAAARLGFLRLQRRREPHGILHTLDEIAREHDEASVHEGEAVVLPVLPVDVDGPAAVEARDRPARHLVRELRRPEQHVLVHLGDEGVVLGQPQRVDEPEQSLAAVLVLLAREHGEVAVLSLLGVGLRGVGAAEDEAGGGIPEWDLHHFGQPGVAHDVAPVALLQHRHDADEQALRRGGHEPGRRANERAVCWQRLEFHQRPT
eukprot:scaffold1087_cov64-Phaeocystis_antarctica.AAC.4